MKLTDDAIKQMQAEAKEVNFRQYEHYGPSSFSNKKIQAYSKGPKMTDRSVEIIELYNKGMRADQIRREVGGTKESIVEALKRHQDKLHDRTGVTYNLKINGKEFDLIMRALASYERNVSLPEFEKCQQVSKILRLSKKRWRYE